MPFKINISDKGKTYKLETESEVLIGKKIGENIDGKDISADLNGYELQITGTSDISGFPGKKQLEGIKYHRVLLKKGFGMHDSRKGIRLRKTLRGEEISSKTSQINTIVIKEGTKKFSELLPKKEKTEEKPAEEKAAEEKAA
jgi:ribosomal protein S6E (S10)